MNGPSRRSDGFTVLEVLVAFVIFAMVLTAVLKAFSSGFENTRVADDYAVATFLAESRLAALGVESELAPGQTSGRFGNGFSWRATVEPYQGGGDENGWENPAVRPMTVTVSVNWGDGEDDRSVSLTSIRLSPAR